MIHPGLQRRRIIIIRLALETSNVKLLAGGLIFGYGSFVRRRTRSREEKRIGLPKKNIIPFFTIYSHYLLPNLALFKDRARIFIIIFGVILRGHHRSRVMFQSRATLPKVINHFHQLGVIPASHTPLTSPNGSLLNNGH